MPTIKNDISIGTVWGYLTVIGKVRSEIKIDGGVKTYKYLIPVRCRCGTELEANRRSLCSGVVKSCGCLNLRVNPAEFVGKTFGSLHVIEFARAYKGNSIFLCICNICGKTKEVIVSKLKTKSSHCTCGARPKKHGLINTRIYNIWAMMLDRCRNMNSHIYKFYGGRGITVCDRWKDFRNFYEDMKEGYSDELSLDRERVNGNYEKSNCRWATKLQQARNTRSNKPVTHDGETKLICEWADVSGIPGIVISGRLRLGWSTQDSIFTPVQKNPLLNIINNRKPKGHDFKN